MPGCGFHGFGLLLCFQELLDFKHWKSFYDLELNYQDPVKPFVMIVVNKAHTIQIPLRTGGMGKAAHGDLRYALVTRL
jgi:hypothetical protein